MAIAVAILVAVLAGAVLVYFFYLRKPAHKVAPVPPVMPQAAPAQDEVEITEEELASLKEIPALKSELSEIKALLKELEGEVEPEPEPEPPPEEWEEHKVNSNTIILTRKNGNSHSETELPPEDKPIPPKRVWTDEQKAALSQKMKHKKAKA